MALSVTSSIPAPGVELWVYDNLDTADTSPTVIKSGSFSTLSGFIQVVGTFGGATVKLQGSNDGTNWIDLTDPLGTTIGIDAAGGKEFSTAALYIRPLAVSGTGDVYITLRS